MSLIAVLVVAVRADSGGVVNDEPKSVVSDATTDSINSDAQVKTKQRIIEIPYQKLTDGDPAYNIVIQPGDVIRVAPRGEYVYINGEVNRPGTYNIPGSNNLTLRQLIVSSGGFSKDSPPKYAKLFRRLGPDTEQTLYFSLDDVFDGWAQDTFLAPNDLVQVSTEPGPEDEQAKQRRLFREQLPTLQAELANLHKQIERATDEHEKGRRLIQSIKDKIKAADQKVAKIKKNLHHDGKSVVMKILSAPQDRWAGKPPRAEDLLVHPLPNTAQPDESVTVIASSSGDDFEQTTFQRMLDSEGVLKLPGIDAVSFFGRSIDELEAEILASMQAQPNYRNVDRVAITLPGRWYFSVMSQPQTGGDGVPLYKIPQPDFRLRDALRMVPGIPTDARIIRVIRQEPIPLTSTQP